MRSLPFSQLSPPQTKLAPTAGASGGAPHPPPTVNPLTPQPSLTAQPLTTQPAHTAQPLTAYPLPTTLKFDAWARALHRHPNRAEVELALHGIACGAKVLYNGPRSSQDSPNLQSALQQPAAITADLSKESEAGRMAGPLPAPPSNPFKVSPIGAVPKKGSDEYRRIHHLSHPAGESVNDFIDDVRLDYVSFDVSAAHTPLSARPAHIARCLPL